MSVPPIGAVAGAVSGVTGVSGTAGLDGTSSTDGVAQASGTSFASTLASSMENVQQLQADQSDLAVKAATGDLNDVADYTIAASKAQMVTQVTVAIRDKAVDAFNEIMRMQV